MTGWRWSRRSAAAAVLGLATAGWLFGAGLRSAGAEDATVIRVAPGIYTATGKSAGGKAYTGQVAIEPLGKVLAVLWRLESGAAYKGLGLTMGPVFGAAYGTDKPFGLVLYHVTSGRLNGRWTRVVDDGKLVGHEVLQGPEGLNGSYTIALGENPNGGRYTGHVEIRPNGATYALRWFTPEAAEIGTGILMQDVLVVAYGRAPGFGVVAYHRVDDRLEGVWAGTLAKQTGTEELTPKAP
jgi:hypothetical protein